MAPSRVASDRRLASACSTTTCRTGSSPSGRSCLPPSPRPDPRVRRPPTGGRHRVAKNAAGSDVDRRARPGDRADPTGSPASPGRWPRLPPARQAHRADLHQSSVPAGPGDLAEQQTPGHRRDDPHRQEPPEGGRPGPANTFTLRWFSAPVTPSPVQQAATTAGRVVVATDVYSTRPAIPRRTKDTVNDAMPLSLSDQTGSAR